MLHSNQDCKHSTTNTILILESIMLESFKQCARMRTRGAAIVPIDAHHRLENEYE